jgi:hypothetical protein
MSDHATIIRQTAASHRKICPMGTPHSERELRLTLLLDNAVALAESLQSEVQYLNQILDAERERGHSSLGD